MDDAIRQILGAKPGDEILTAKQEDYYNGNPLVKNIYNEIVDIVRDNGKLIILTK